MWTEDTGSKCSASQATRSERAETLEVITVGREPLVKCSWESLENRTREPQVMSTWELEPMETSARELEPLKTSTQGLEPPETSAQGLELLETSAQELETPETSAQGLELPWMGTTGSEHSRSEAPEGACF